MKKIEKIDEKVIQKVKVHGGMEACMTDCAYKGNNISVTACPVYTMYYDGPNL